LEHRKPEGNERAQLPSGFLCPEVMNIGPLSVGAQSSWIAVSVIRGRQSQQ